MSEERCASLGQDVRVPGKNLSRESLRGLSSIFSLQMRTYVCTSIQRMYESIHNYSRIREAGTYVRFKEDNDAEKEQEELQAKLCRRTSSLLFPSTFT